MLQLTELDGLVRRSLSVPFPFFFQVPRFGCIAQSNVQATDTPLTRSTGDEQLYPLLPSTCQRCVDDHADQWAQVDEACFCAQHLANATHMCVARCTLRHTPSNLHHTDHIQISSPHLSHSGPLCYRGCKYGVTIAVYMRSCRHIVDYFRTSRSKLALRQ